MHRYKKSAGFTLIELLVVIAVIGVLAGAVIAMINPSEQINRAKDADARSGVDQLGKSVERYQIVTGGTVPNGTSWMQTLVNSSELKSLLPATPQGCNAANNQNNYCYANVGSYFLVWAIPWSKAETTKCGGAAAFYTYDSTIGRTCLKCTDIGSSVACNATQ